MQLFIDECLSPSLAKELNDTGKHVCQHPRDFGGRGAPDHVVLARCVEHSLTIVTQNAKDFKALVGREEIHPGLIILPCVGKARSRDLLNRVLHHLEEMGDPNDVMINNVLEIDSTGSIQMTTLPELS